MLSQRSTQATTLQIDSIEEQKPIPDQPADDVMLIITRKNLEKLLFLNTREFLLTYKNRLAEKQRQIVDTISSIEALKQKNSKDFQYSINSGIENPRKNNIPEELIESNKEDLQYEIQEIEKSGPSSQNKNVRYITMEELGSLNEDEVIHYIINREVLNNFKAIHGYSKKLDEQEKKDDMQLKHQLSILEYEKSIAAFIEAQKKKPILHPERILREIIGMFNLTGYSLNNLKITYMHLTNSTTHTFKYTIENDDEEASNAIYKTAITLSYFALVVVGLNLVSRMNMSFLSKEEYIDHQIKNRQHILSSNNLFFRGFRAVAHPTPFSVNDNELTAQGSPTENNEKFNIVHLLNDNKFKMIVLAACFLDEFFKQIYDTENNFYFGSAIAAVVLYKTFILSYLMVQASNLDDALIDPARAIKQHENFTIAFENIFNRAGNTSNKICKKKNTTPSVATCEEITTSMIEEEEKNNNSINSGPRLRKYSCN